jgi:SAM-dependent methyltransferase
MKINKLVINSSESITDLCNLGVKHPTDKSAYAQNNLHRHGYMAIYDMLFMTLRYKNIKLAEGGILNNMSMKCWREYFPYAELHGFDFDDNLLQVAKNDNLANTTYYKMDVNDTNSILNTFNSTGGNFDVIIDDMIHDVHHNALFAKEAYKFLKPSGLLIIEDINELYNEEFGGNHEELYNQYFNPIEKYFSSMTFIVSEHKNKFSGGLNNDKLLVFSRNEVLD